MQDWKDLESRAQLEAIITASSQKPQLIFKHSVSCGISAQVWHQMSNATDSLKDAVDLHYLDLLSFRPVSNQVARDLNVPHQSPQVIVLRDGKAVYNTSHFSINPAKIKQSVEAAKQD